MAEGGVEGYVAVEAFPEKNLKTDLWEVLENMEGRNDINEGRRKRQKQVFDNLPGDFEYAMKGAYMDNETHVWGELFEFLVRADTKISGEPETELGSTLRNVLHNPERYGLEKLGFSSRMNPDTCKVNAKQEIVGVIEAKAKPKPIDLRAYKQLRNFKYNFQNLLDDLRQFKGKALRKLGLGVVADNKQHLKVSRNFKITIAIPSFVYDGDLESIVDAKDFNKGEMEGVLRVLGWCKIVESPFSVKEIEVMTRYIDKRFNNSGPEKGVSAPGKVKVVETRSSTGEKFKKKYPRNPFQLHLNKDILTRLDVDGRGKKFMETWLYRTQEIKKISFKTLGESLHEVVVTTLGDQEVGIPADLFISVLGNKISRIKGVGLVGFRLKTQNGNAKLIETHSPQKMSERGEDWRDIVKRIVINDVPLKDDVEIVMEEIKPKNMDTLRDVSYNTV